IFYRRKMTFARSLLIFALIFACLLACDYDCNNCEKAKGALCWYNAWEKRDERCGEEIDKEDDRRFSFEHLDGRCYCCPPPEVEEVEQNSAESEVSEDDTSEEKPTWGHCASNCNDCDAAERASVCFISEKKRDDRCGSEIGRVDDRRFSFPRPVGERCYCCPA
ncbi:hypothetical protein PFISCL1PPCAC_18224, partial [Pristionchus fissidentatus]